MQAMCLKVVGCEFMHWLKMLFIIKRFWMTIKHLLNSNATLHINLKQQLNKVIQTIIFLIFLQENLQNLDIRSLGFETGSHSVARFWPCPTNWLKLWTIIQTFCSFFPKDSCISLYLNYTEWNTYISYNTCP